jgi:uncharacterized membrane protein
MYIFIEIVILLLIYNNIRKKIISIETRLLQLSSTIENKDSNSPINNISSEINIDSKHEAKKQLINNIQPDITINQSPKQADANLEQQIGLNISVWIGSIAIAFAGFFMVKYSIEKGLLSPTVRILLGILFGFGLLYAAHFMRTKITIANGMRISQALSGAGICYKKIWLLFSPCSIATVSYGALNLITSAAL